MEWLEPMHEYQERVKTEKAELDEKLTKLAAFVASEKFRDVPAAEQDRMRRQREIMWQYSEVLAERINAF